MSGIYLLNIHILTELADEMGRFASEIISTLRSAHVEIHQALDWIQGVVSECHRNVELAIESVTEAEALLSRCQSSGYYSPEGFYVPPDCGNEEAELVRARIHLRECEQKLQTAYHWQERVEQVASGFQGQEQRLMELAESHTGHARAALHNLSVRYAAVHVAAISVPKGTSAASVDTSGISTSRPTWVDRGIQKVSVQNLPDPEGIAGVQDFSKVTSDEMHIGLNRLQEMTPTVEGGAGASSDYWAAYDRRYGLDYAHGYQRIYDAFYGQDAICVNKIGNIYDIINGRHRIWLAKQMGISSLPIRVIEAK